MDDHTECQVAELWDKICTLHGVEYKKTTPFTRKIVHIFSINLACKQKSWDVLKISVLFSHISQ